MKAIFNYSESDEIIYCQRCGQIAGESTKCVHSYSEHNFAKTEKHLICARCGVSIGRTTKCTGGYTSHKFKIIN